MKQLAIGILLVAGGMTGGVWPTVGMASDYPSRPIQMVVPFPPGGNIDVTARLIAQPMAEALGTTVVVENRPGAGGTIGASAVARSRSDGHMLLVAGSTVSIAPFIYREPGFDPNRDLTPIGGIQTVPVVLVAHPDFPPSSFEQLRKYAATKPEALTTATSGTGSAPHLALERLMADAGLRMSHIPYRGGAPALSDLLGGHVNLMVDQLNTSLPHLLGGKIKAIAQLGKERSPLLPDVPTLSEQGVEGFDAQTYVGLFAPADLPPEVEKKLVQALATALQKPEVREQFQKIGTTVMDMDQAAFRDFVNTDIQRTQEVVRLTGIVAE